jgi:hypothetical protein
MGWFCGSVRGVPTAKNHRRKRRARRFPLIHYTISPRIFQYLPSIFRERFVRAVCGYSVRAERNIVHLRPADTNKKLRKLNTFGVFGHELTEKMPVVIS